MAKSKKPKKDYEGNIFTKSDAKSYLDESVELWDKDPEFDHFLVSLARFAERWRTNVGQWHKIMGALYTNIRQNENKIKRHLILSKPTKALEEEIKADKKQLAVLEAEHGKYIPPKNKKKAEKTE